ncbi:helix-turn-helix domain-containing protein [Oceanobacillus jeddahense]|uniref:helix-turn-helix domain-containing protein n=1 Tax=Oceanobacillus jeddahense TaxID=1462527 RepID=UPI00363AFF80
MKVKKAFRFRIYPNKKQLTFIHKTIGCSRFVYNYFTGKQKEKDHYWLICYLYSRQRNNKNSLLL